MYLTGFKAPTNWLTCDWTRWWYSVVLGIALCDDLLPDQITVQSLVLCFNQMTVQWKTEARQFQLSVGTCQPSSTANPHLLVLVQLQEELNTSRSLAQLVQVCVWYTVWGGGGDGETLPKCPSTVVGGKKKTPDQWFSFYRYVLGGQRYGSLWGGGMVGFGWGVERGLWWAVGVGGCVFWGGRSQGRLRG